MPELVQSILPPGVVESPLGLILPDDISDADWTRLAQHFAARRRAASWALADLILHAEGKRVDNYNWAHANCGIAYGTCANLASAARTFPISRRREKLSIGHHLAVAALEPSEQDELLDKAESQEYGCKTREDLRDQAKRIQIEKRQLLTVNEPPRPRAPMQTAYLATEHYRGGLTLPKVVKLNAPAPEYQTFKPLEKATVGDVLKPTPTFTDALADFRILADRYGELDIDGLAELIRDLERRVDRERLPIARVVH